MAELSKVYDPKLVESKWYPAWIEKGVFKADPDSTKPPYSIVIPPPNVTGILHMGHVLNNTIQDILARQARMLGKEVLWLPGTDHAGIATQVMVERMLKKEEKTTRYALGRDKFIDRVWQWKEKHGGIIIDQLKQLGCSCDWSRERFTMDADYSRQVSETFVDLYRKGLIYRGKRMINWCPVSQTALSDEEVVMKPQNGRLCYFRVRILERPDLFLTIATTRPETIPGDSAVAVHPKDPRYRDYIGLHVLRPIPSELPDSEKLIPIVGDETVDFEFGTGVLKVTPAHDKADFEIGQRHGLRRIEVINESGKMTAASGSVLEGLDRFEARKKAVDLLRELGSLEKEEPYQNNVGFSERADVPIEPRLSEQWFLRYPSVKEAEQAALDGRLRFFPDRWRKVYEHWLANIQDWCISRQLWWGHRIPVWYRDGETRCQVASPGADWVQDADVLDTWFSSWLWPFATMDEKTMSTFYPTSVLVSGPDILFFWVARMVMAGIEYTGQVPFRDVYLTGIVRDKVGRKMSKTLGNSPDPLDLIARFSADALRFGVIRSAPLGQDVLFDEQQVELGRNFCNKLWNACRFRQMQGGETEGEIQAEFLREEDRWILIKLDRAIAEITDSLEEYCFNEAAQALYRFFWSEFCDWYLECSKAILSGTDATRKSATLAVMDFLLSNVLRLFHPFLPFITEELWMGMGFNLDLPSEQGGSTISFAPWPKRFDSDFRAHYGLRDEIERIVGEKFELVSLARNLRRERNIAASRKLEFILRREAPLSDSDIPMLKQLLNAADIRAQLDYVAPRGTAAIRNVWGELFLPMAGLVDSDAERSRLVKELTRIQAEIDKVSEKLRNPEFLKRVPESVLRDHQSRLDDWRGKLEQVEAALAELA